MKSLMQIVQEHKSLDQLLLDGGGEITSEEQEAIVDAWIVEIKSNLSQKIDGYKYKQDSLDSAVENLKARSSMISRAAKVLANMSDLLKERLKLAMNDLNKRELTGNDFKFKLSDAKSGLIYDEELIPIRYIKVKTVTEIDEDLLRKDLELGMDVPGARLEPRFRLNVTANNKLKEIK